MKQLTCEMCGGTDLIKQDGVFVCQTCGCKYSIEEARKMMVEGTVEVQGVVQVSNSAQVTNLLNMAQSSFDSKNYAKAEEFCNQVISMDDKNSDAWKLKGEAINYQINANNPRILEVYNCLMTSFRITKMEFAEVLPLDSAGNIDEYVDTETNKDQALALLKWDEKKFQIFTSLKTCMEGEVDFWLDQFESGRPTKSALTKVKNTYVDCYNKMKAAFEEMGMGAGSYLKTFDNHFCSKANATCTSAWKSTVGYNYFRDDFGNLGANWNRDPKKKEYFKSTNSVYRPNKNTLDTFDLETSLLIALLEYCIEQFNDLTRPEIKKNIYSNLSFFYKISPEQVCYKPMVSTTTNGYGAVTKRSEYYQVDQWYKDDFKQEQNEISKKYATLRDMAKKEGEDKKRAEYWAEHAEEKAALEAENTTLKEQFERLRAQLVSLPQITEVSKIEEQIAEKEKAIMMLGIFKAKEKKALQAELDVLKARLTEATKARDEVVDPINEEIEKLKQRISEIDTELTKDR